MKRIVLQTLTMLLTTTLFLMTAMAHQPPNPMAPNSNIGYLNIPPLLKALADPKLSQAIKHTVDFANHPPENVAHNSIINVEDLKAALDGIPGDMNLLAGPFLALDALGPGRVDGYLADSGFNYPQKVKLWKLEAAMDSKSLEVDERLIKHRIPHPWVNVNPTDDKVVDFQDLVLVGNARYFGDALPFDAEKDANRNGVNDIYDIILVASQIDQTVVPGADAVSGVQFSVQDIDRWIGEINKEKTPKLVKSVGTAYLNRSNASERSIAIVRQRDSAVTALNRLKTLLLSSADVDRSGAVDFKDLILVGNAIKKAPSVADTHPDANRSGGVDVADIIFVAERVPLVDIDTATATLRTLVLTTKPVFTAAEVLSWRNQATGNAAKVLLQLTEAPKIAGANVDCDGDVDFEDLIKVGNVIKTGVTPDGVKPNANGGGKVEPDVYDILFVAGEIPALGRTSKAVTDALKTTTPKFTAMDVDPWINKATELNRPDLANILRLLKNGLPLANADVDDSGTIDVVDLIKVANAVKNPSNAPPGTNADGSGDIDSDDIIFVARSLGTFSKTSLFAAVIANGITFTNADIVTWSNKAQELEEPTLTAVFLKLASAPLMAKYDIDRDRDVDFEDLIKVGNVVKTGVTPAGVYPDVVGLPLLNAVVDVRDIHAVAQRIMDNTQQAATTALGTTTPSFSVTDIDEWIGTISGWGRPSPTAILVLNRLKTALSAPQAPALTQSAADVRVALEEARLLNADPATIVTLERLLARLVHAETPKKTALLTNYPNPFNPETWIPYQLSTSAKVHIAIYAADGRLVRTLDLGHLPAGRYHEKSSAAYWDGRNAQGEPVASGLYFYTFTAGEFTATKKMLIRK